MWRTFSSAAIASGSFALRRGISVVFQRQSHLSVLQTNIFSKNAAISPMNTANIGVRMIATSSLPLNLKERFPDYDFLAKYQKQEKEEGKPRKPKIAPLPKLTLEEKFHGVRSKGDNPFLDAVDEGDTTTAVFLIKNRNRRAVSLKKSSFPGRAVQILLETLAKQDNFAGIEELIPILPKIVKLDLSFVHVLKSLNKSNSWSNKVDLLLAMDETSKRTKLENKQSQKVASISDQYEESQITSNALKSSIKNANEDAAQASHSKDISRVENQTVIEDEPDYSALKTEREMEDLVSKVFDDQSPPHESFDTQVVKLLRKKMYREAILLVKADKSGEKLGVATYNKVLHGCLKIPNYEDFDTLFKLFKRKTGHRVAGDTNYIRALRFSDVKEYEKAVTAIRTTPALIDYEYYARLIVALVREDSVSKETIEAAGSLLEDIRKAGKRLNIKVFSDVINGCITTGNHDLLFSTIDTMINNFKMMPSEDFCRDISKRMSAKGQWGLIVKLLNIMNTHRIYIPSSMVTTLFASVYDTENWNTASEVVDFASAHGVKLKEDMILSMLQKTVSEGDSSNVEKTLAYASKSDISIPPQLATHIYIWSCLPNRVRPSLQILDHMTAISPQQLSLPLATRLRDSLEKIETDATLTVNEKQIITALMPKVLKATTHAEAKLNTQDSQND